MTQQYKTKQRNYKRNGDVIANTDLTKTILDDIGYSLNVSITSNPWSMNGVGNLLYSEDTNYDTMVFDDGGKLIVQFNPYLYITVDSTPEYLTANIPDDIESTDLIFNIDQTTGDLIITDTRI